ncbi:MAG TPA: iron-sulfur cluster carrier protein ApbC [Gammaproteobacteria bacterium]|nr:iron-sulfur cluster carrier protein ApbC [Gammaproteobacteria bacterium]
MSDSARSTLQEALGSFVVPYTGRPLGGPGAAFTLERRGSVWHVTVQLGFPLAASGEALADAVRMHCAAALEGASLEITIESSIVAHAVQHGLKPLPGAHNLIAVASGKGGVGKSTVAVNFALALKAEGAKVGLLDADIYGPSQPRMLGLVGRRPETRDGKLLEPLVAHGIEAMSIGFLVDEQQPMAWRGPMVTSALNQLLTQTRWGDLDYLIVDMPPGTGDIQLTLAQRVPVSGAVIVTTPQDIALADARKGLEMFQKVHVPVLGVVENMSLHICSRCGHEEHIFGEHGGRNLAEQYGVPLLGALPLDRRIREETDQGKPTVAADPKSPLARAFTEAALRAAGELAARAKDYSRLFPNITVEDN